MLADFGPSEPMLCVWPDKIAAQARRFLSGFSGHVLYAVKANPVATVVGMIAEGISSEEILEDYPDLEIADIQEALRFAAEAVREREIPSLDREISDRQCSVCHSG